MVLPPLSSTWGAPQHLPQRPPFQKLASCPKTALATYQSLAPLPKGIWSLGLQGRKVPSLPVSVGDTTLSLTKISFQPLIPSNCPLSVLASAAHILTTPSALLPHSLAPGSPDSMKENISLLWAAGL